MARRDRSVCTGIMSYPSAPDQPDKALAGLMVKGLANEAAAQLVAHRGDEAYASVEEIWRRADIPSTALERLAEADAYRGIGLDRRRALWAVKGLADEALPLFAAADAGRRPQPEVV